MLPFFAKPGHSICEVNTFKPAFASWFAGDAVIQDGTTYLATRVDPLFLLLPCLEAVAARGYCDTEAILEAAGPAHAGVAALRQAQLGPICEVKTVGGGAYYQLSEQKTLAWLKAKVNKTKTGLKSTKGTGWADAEDAALEAYTAGLMGEYLAPHWVERMHVHLGLNTDDDLTAPVECPYPALDPDPTPKRPKVDPKEAARLKAAESRLQNKAAKMAKEAAGMRKLSGFFAPKPSST